MAMKETDYLTLLGKLEHLDGWGFGDVFELLCFRTHVLANAFESGRVGFEKIESALMDVWTTVEDSISDGKIRVTSGKLIDVSAGPLFTENSNILVVDKKSFLSWYRKDKEKIVQYLSCANLKIHQEAFLDRLANKEPLKNLRPITGRAKMNRLRENYISAAIKKLKVNPNLQSPYFKDDYSFKKLIRGSGLLEDKQPKDSTLHGWIREARKAAKKKI